VVFRPVLGHFLIDFRNYFFDVCAHIAGIRINISRFLSWQLHVLFTIYKNTGFVTAATLTLAVGIASRLFWSSLLAHAHHYPHYLYVLPIAQPNIPLPF
jgi:hypothetical protein